MANLETLVMTELKKAMIEKNEAHMRALRAIKAAVLLAKTAEHAGNIITESEEIKILQKLIKQRKDALEIYETQNRPDLAQKEKEEITVIQKFLPQQLSDAEIEAALKEIIKKVNASSLADLGKVMGIATKELSGTADGKRISELAKKLIS